MPSIYLAGPWVFAPAPASIAESLSAQCRLHGIEAIMPIDGKTIELTGAARAAAIYKANCEKIGFADAVVADITPFRGVHMDPGTAFEVGYATALGKPVFCYTLTDQPMYLRASARKATDGRWRDAHGFAVEDFGLGENLMIACAAGGVFPHAAAAIGQAAESLKATRS